MEDIIGGNEVNIMQDYQALKQYWLDLLIKSNLHEKRVWVVPKDGKTRPHWRTVRVKDDDSQTDTRMKKQDDEAKGRIKKPEENPNPRTKKLEDTSNSRNREQDNKNTRGVTQDASNTAPAKSNIQQGQKHWNTMKIPKAIKQAASDHLSKFGSRDEFLKDLKDKGITWNEHSHAGINHMRAMMALNAAIMNESHGFKSPFSGENPTQFAQSSIQQDDKSVKKQSKSKTPTDKVSKESKAKTHEFFMSCADRDEFYTKLKQLGVKWTENDHPAINFMRAKMALSLKVENGFDPSNPPSTDEVIAQQNGIDTVSVEDTSKESYPPNKEESDISSNKEESDISSNKEESDISSNKEESDISSNKEESDSAFQNKVMQESKFYKAVGEKYYNTIDKLVKSSSYKTTAKVWSSHVHTMNITLDENSPRCYYTAGFNRLFLSSVEQLSRGNSYLLPHSSLFHEGGHCIDYTNGKHVEDGEIPYSALYKDGAFIKALHDDVNQLLAKIVPDIKDIPGKIDEYITKQADVAAEASEQLNEHFGEGLGDVDWLVQNNFITPAAVPHFQEYIDLLNKQIEENDEPDEETYVLFYNELVDSAVRLRHKDKVIDNINTAMKAELTKVVGGDKKRVHLDCGCITDVISGATRGAIRCGLCHETSYWIESRVNGIETPLATEAFAEMLEVEMTNPDATTYLKTYLPTAYKVYQDMIKDLNK